MATPDGWMSARLGEVGRVIRGVTYAKHQASSEAGEDRVPLLRATNISDSGLVLDDLVWIPRDLVSAEQEIREGDMVIVASSGSSRIVGRSVLVPHGLDATFGAFCFVYRPSPLMNAKWISYWMRSPSYRSEVSAQAKGTNINNLKRDTITSAPILVPPREEQDVIVARLDELLSEIDTAVADLQAARVETELFERSLLRRVFKGELTEAPGSATATADGILASFEMERVQRIASGGKKVKPPAQAAVSDEQLPSHWRVCSLEAATDPIRVICYGILMPKDHVEDGVPYVKVKDMRDGGIELSSLQRTAPEIASKYSRASLVPGDVLLAIRGTYGRVAIVPPELEGGNITQDTARIAPLPGLDAEYLWSYLASPAAAAYYDRVARGVAVKGVNIGDLRAMPIPIPPLEEQRAITKMLRERRAWINDVKEVLGEQLQDAQALRDAVIQSAVTGRLFRSGAHGSAEALLREIQQELTEVPRNNGRGKKARAANAVS